MPNSKLKGLLTSFIKYSPHLIIITVALIPVYHTWGRLAIGGDVMMFFDRYGISKYLYQWVGVQNGQYFSINYYPYFLFYKIVGLFTNNVYTASSVLLASLTLIGGFGIYKLCGVFSKPIDRVAVAASILFYLLSPALFNGYHYLFIYYFSPWFIYFVFKISSSKSFPALDIFLLNLVLVFCSLDLPNPKYVFHLLIISLVIFLSVRILKLTQVRSLSIYIARITITFLVSVHLMLPLAYFALNYLPEDYNVQDYSNLNRLPNYQIDTLDKVFKLHQDFVFLNTKDANTYNNNKIVLAASYLAALLILIYFLRVRPASKDESGQETIIWILLLVYIFFSAGPNYPLGFVYHFMVTKASLLAFLRTTAGAVFFLSIFYSLLLFFFIKRLKKYKIPVAMLLMASTVFVGYPFVNGDYYKNFNTINPNTDTEEKGIVIPQTYYRAREILDYQKIDARTLYPNTKLSYLTTKWGFFGPPIYNFLYDTYNIACNKVVGGTAKHNIGFVFFDHSLQGDAKCRVNNTAPAWSNGFIEINYVNLNSYLPRVYVATKIIEVSDRVSTPQELNQPETGVRSVTVPFDTRSTSSIASTDRSEPIIEYKKVNPTKYKLIIHNATNAFVLVLSEHFHKDWVLYLTPRVKKPSDYPTSLLRDAAENYKVLDKNEYFQADKAELANYINRGWISTLGNTGEKTIQHFSWERSSGKVSYTEKYRIDFVSKNFQGTIQNNNLPNGSSWETWFLSRASQLPKENHLTVNGYANGWILDTSKLCITNSFCTKDTNGSYDIQLILEFWPQKLFYIATGLSAVVLVLGAVYSCRKTICSKKKALTDRKLEIK